MQQKTIKITGEGKKTYKPDQIIIRIEYEEVLPTYDEALNAAAEYTKVIKTKAVSAGVTETNVTTHSFSVSPKTISVKDERGNYHSKLIGYEASVGFSIKIPVDNKLLSKILYTLKEHKGTFRFFYVLKDREKANEEVMELAVKAAVKKAEILAKAAGETLGEILNIDYSYGRVEFEYDRGMVYECSKPMIVGSAPEIDIDPEELEIKDTVNIIWALK